MVSHEMDHLDGLNMFDNGMSWGTINYDDNLEDKIKEMEEKLKS